MFLIFQFHFNTFPQYIQKNGIGLIFLYFKKKYHFTPFSRYFKEQYDWKIQVVCNTRMGNSASCSKRSSHVLKCLKLTLQDHYSGQNLYVLAFQSNFFPSLLHLPWKLGFSFSHVNVFFLETILTKSFSYDNFTKSGLFVYCQS